MNSLFSAKLNAFRAGNTVADNLIGSNRSAVLPHQFLLFFLCVWDEKSFRILNKTSGSKFAVGFWERRIKTGATEAGFFVIFRKLDNVYIHFPKQAAYVGLYVRTVIRTPAVLKSHGFLVKIRKFEIGFLIQNLPERNDFGG